MAGPRSLNTSTVLMFVGLFCVGLICYNLNIIQSQMEESLTNEPGSRRKRLVDGLTESIGKLVRRDTDKDMSSILSAVKSKLEVEIEEAMQEEAKHALEAAVAGQNTWDVRPRPRSIPNFNSMQKMPDHTKIGAKITGKEDMDIAIEERVRQLEEEERLQPSVKHGFYIAGWVKHPPWPFQKINDRNGKDTGVIGLCAPFIKYYYNSEWEKGLFWRLKAQGHVMLGISSYEWFPGNATNPHTDRPPQHTKEDKKIFAAMDAWIHCFREPHLHVPPGIPRALISQSDFVDPNNGDLKPRGLPNKYLFAYSNLGGDWNEFNRNWTLAKECVKIAANKGLKVLLVGKKKDLDKPSMKEIKPLVDSGKIEASDTLPHNKLGDVMEQSEFFFIPNLSDASPRVAAEALSRGTPLLMNYHIVGGWKYINEQTGVFFDGVDDFLPAVERLRALKKAGKLRPREWYSENFGPRKASLRLQAFLELTVGKERLQKVKELPHTASAAHRGL